jgi:hypothetical protein
MRVLFLFGIISTFSHSASSSLLPVSPLIPLCFPSVLPPLPPAHAAMAIDLAFGPILKTCVCLGCLPSGVETSRRHIQGDRRKAFKMTALCTSISVVSTTLPHLVSPSPLSAPLLSSYVGGSVNFVLMCERRGIPLDIVSAVGGVDCFVMGAYLAGLHSLGTRKLKSRKSTVEVPESAPRLTAQTLLLVPLVFILLKSSSIVPQLFPALHPILSTTLSLVPICAVPPLIPIAAPSWTKSLLR